MHSAGKLILLQLLWISPISMAQVASHMIDPNLGCELETSARDGPICRIGTIPARVINREIKLSTHLEAPKIEPRDCEVEVAVQYHQRYSIARVAGSIENKSCAASGGSLVIAISTKDENDELKTREYPQTWKREDEESVTFSADYEIGNNVSLVRARALKVTCRCDSAK